MSEYLKNISVLVADDQFFIRSMVREVLTRIGCTRVKEADNGKRAWEMVAGFKPDIIIADWEMPPTSGLAFTKRIRTDPASPDPYVPIIMMTGYTEFDRVVEARDAGINEYLIKPISAKVLLSRIQTVIERPRDFIRTKKYFGPDRRRKTVPVKKDRRRADTEKPDSKSVSA